MPTGCQRRGGRGATVGRAMVGNGLVLSGDYVWGNVCRAESSRRIYDFIGVRDCLAIQEADNHAIFRIFANCCGTASMCI